MPPSFKNLRIVQSIAKVRDTLTDTMGAGGLPVTAWGDNTQPRLMLEGIARTLADVYVFVVAVAEGGYGDTARGAWKDVWAWDRYRTLRDQVRFTSGIWRAVDTGGGPHTIAAGALIGGTVDGLTFTTTASVVVPLLGSASLPVRAMTGGSAHNIPSGTPLGLVTDFPGLLVSCPPQAGSETWITSAGADVESDPSLYAKAVGRWATLSVATPGAYYAARIREAVPTITKVTIDDENPLGPGSCECICATGAGPASSSDIILANSLLQTIRSKGAGKLQARSAVARSYAVAGVAYVRAADIVAARAAIATELARMQVELPIGGTVYASEIVRIVKSQTGVRDFLPAAGLVNTTVNVDEVATLRHEITYVAE